VESIAHTLLDDKAHQQFARIGDVTGTWYARGTGALRVHAYRTECGMTLAIRFLAKSIPTVESLHLPPVVASFVESVAGLLIVAGPAGSGKSTTLAGLIGHINRTQSKHIITIEDPIEYRHESSHSIVSQREVGRDVPSFVAGLYGALRSDPDIIVVGEMRDPATMHAALTAAETGHLVLATLHTGDAPQTVDRIIGVFTDGMQEQIRITLAQTLLGVVCMRLVLHAGGTGRRAAVEVLTATDAVRNLIRDGKTHQLRNVLSTSRQSGMQTLESHLCDLIADGEITIEGARRATARVDDLRAARGPR
jgi:twitching motility protein PilT